jgi:Uma2 family endonuclease
MTLRSASRKTKPSSPRDRLFKPDMRLLTAADLAVLPDELPSGPVKWELANGRLIVMPLPGDIHGAVEANVVGELKIQGEKPGHGKVRCGDVGIILWRNPDRVVGADAAFIALTSLPIKLSKEGWLETIPDLVVEVRSKNDTWKEVLDKVADYLYAGVRLVWVIDPKKEIVTAFRPARKPKVFKKTDSLTADDIIPGFRMLVADVFAV